MTLVTLLLAALALGLVNARVLLRDRVDARRGLAALVGLLVAGVGLFDWQVLPERVTILHEGGTRRMVDAFFGRDQHVGWLWLDVAGGLLARAGELPVEGVIRLNLVLALLSAVGLAAVAWAATGRALAVPLTWLLLSESRGFWNAAHSETPAPAVWFAFVTAVPAWRLLDDARTRPPDQHLLALASLLVSAALAAGVREEFALHGAVFVGLAVVTFLAGGALPADLFVRVRHAAVALLRAPWPARLAVLAAAAVAIELSERMGVPFRPRLVLVALLPSAYSVLGALSALSVTPLPVVALAALGIVSLARGGVARAAFALATTSLLGVHVAASHGVGWEMFRYGAHDLMALWLAAVAGWCALEDFAAERGWHPSWRSSLAMVAAALALAPSRFEASAPEWWDVDARARQGPSRRLADQAKQREGRLLLRALAAEPRCLFVGRMRQWGELRGEMRLVTFGVGRPPVAVTDPAVTVRDLRVGAGPCLRYVLTLDCNLRGGARCEDDLRGAAPVRELRERLAAYNDPEEYGEHTPEVRYGVWRVGDDSAP